MRRASPTALPTVLCLALAIAGCAATAGGPNRVRSELGRELADTRRELEEIRRDQERLRAMVEYLQYSAQYGTPIEGAFVPGGGLGPETSGEPANEPSADEPSADEPPVDEGPAGRSASAIDALGLALGAGASGSRENTSPLVEDTLAMATIEAQKPVPEVPPAAVPEAVNQPPAAFAPLPKVLREDAAVSVQSPGIGEGPLEVPLRVAKSLRGSGYDDGIRALADEQWDDAVQYFRDFIYKHSNSSWADDAQFWMGEAYLRKGRYSNAIKMLNQVVLRYGSGNRAAAALMRLADVFTAIGDPIDAKLSLNKLVRLYPESPEAARASVLLGVEVGG